MSIRPLHDRVVIRRNEEESTSAGGIVLPGSAAEKPNQGKVLSVGPGRVTSDGALQSMSVKEGDTVVFGPYAGNNTIKIDGEDLLIVNENEIYGVLED
jgi:chaperonin GroES